MHSVKRLAILNHEHYQCTLIWAVDRRTEERLDLKQARPGTLTFVYYTSLTQTFSWTRRMKGYLTGQIDTKHIQ